MDKKEKVQAMISIDNKDITTVFMVVGIVIIILLAIISRLINGKRYDWHYKNRK